MDELFQLVIFIIILALGLLSSRKKKKRPPTTQRTPSPGRGAPAASTAAGRRRPRAERPGAGRSRLEETLLELLGQQLPETVPPPEIEARSMEVVPPTEARSLEELEISPEARHAEFHERYMEPAVPSPPPQAPRMRLSMSPQSLREAVIWKAVLGPPKGLDP